jgi:hypothetical protein
VEKKSLETEVEVQRLKNQMDLLQNVWSNLQTPTSKRLFALVKQLSRFDNPKNVNDAFELIRLIKHKTGVTGKIESINDAIYTLKIFEKKIEKYSIPNESEIKNKSDSPSNIIDVLSKKQIPEILQNIQNLLESLNDIEQKNQTIITNFKNEKRKLMLKSSSSSKDITKICQEIENKAQNFKKFLIKISTGNNLPEQIKYTKQIINNLRLLSLNLNHLEEDYNKQMINPESKFYLKPINISQKAYEDYLSQNIQKLHANIDVSFCN